MTANSTGPLTTADRKFLEDEIRQWNLAFLAVVLVVCFVVLGV